MIVPLLTPFVCVRVCLLVCCKTFTFDCDYGVCACVQPSHEIPFFQFDDSKKFQSNFNLQLSIFGLINIPRISSQLGQYFLSFQGPKVQNSIENQTLYIQLFFFIQKLYKTKKMLLKQNMMRQRQILKGFDNLVITIMAVSGVYFFKHFYFLVDSSLLHFFFLVLRFNSYFVSK